MKRERENVAKSEIINYLKFLFLLDSSVADSGKIFRVCLNIILNNKVEFYYYLLGFNCGFSNDAIPWPNL